MAKRLIHCCLDIEGGIRNAKDIKGCITIDRRTLMTTEEVKEALRYQLALGRRVLPMGDCDTPPTHWMPLPEPPGGGTKKPPHHRGGLARGNAR